MNPSQNPNSAGEQPPSAPFVPPTPSGAQAPHASPAPDQPLVTQNPDGSLNHNQHKKRNHEGLRSIFSTLFVLLLAPIIALVLTAFVFQSYEVEGPSMQTTLHDKDRLIVLKLPRTIARITKKPYLPNRTDIIIFNRHDAAGAFQGGGEKQLIKRVVGLPGEHVKVQDGILTVYNKEHPNGFQPDKTYPYGKVITTTPGDIEIDVPEGEIFVAGDNRTNSLDSRYFGPVPLEDVVGKLGIRIYPFGQSKVQ